MLTKTDLTSHLPAFWNRLPVRSGAEGSCIQGFIRCRGLDLRLLRRRLQPPVQQILAHRLRVIRQAQQNGPFSGQLHNAAELPLLQSGRGGGQALRQRVIRRQQRPGIVPRPAGGSP